MRGTFANIRIKNQMVPGVEGGVTVHYPSGERLSIYDAAMRYKPDGVPLVVFAGRNTAPAPRATGRPRARRCSACAPSSPNRFERIHRSNLSAWAWCRSPSRKAAHGSLLALKGDEP